MNCESMMEKQVECVTPKTSLREAATKMKTNDIGFLPVCEESRKVIGTLTDRDIVVRGIAAGSNGDAQVESVMTKEVIACRATDDVEKARTLMQSRQVSRIVCLDDKGQLMGVVSLADITKSQSDAGAGKTVKDVKQGGQSASARH